MVCVFLVLLETLGYLFKKKGDVSFSSGNRGMDEEQKNKMALLVKTLKTGGVL